MSKSDSSSAHKDKGVEPLNVQVHSDTKSELRGLDSKDAALAHAYNTEKSAHSTSSSSSNAADSYVDVIAHEDDDGSFASYVEAEPVHKQDSKSIKDVKDVEPEYIDVDVIEDDDDYQDVDAEDVSELAKIEKHFNSSFASEFTDAEAIEPHDNAHNAAIASHDDVHNAAIASHDDVHNAAIASHDDAIDVTDAVTVEDDELDHSDAHAHGAVASDSPSKRGSSTALIKHPDAHDDSETIQSASAQSDVEHSAALVTKHGAGHSSDRAALHDDAEGFDVFDKVKQLSHQHDGYELDDGEHEEELDLESSSYGNFEDEEDSESDHDDFTSNESGMHVFEHDGQGSLDDDEDDSDYSSTTPNLPVAHEGGHKKPSTAIVKAASTAGIGAFIKAANMVPMLTEEEEEELSRRFREEGDLSAARRLVESHLRLVIKEARGFAGYGLPLSDLIQEGNIGLMKAVKRFEPEKGARLSTFSRTYILSEIYEYIICNWRMVKVATTKAQRKILFNLNKFKSELRRFTASERNDVAASLGVSVTDVAEMEKRLSGSDIGFDLDEADSSEKGVAVTMSPSAYLEDETSDFAKTYEQSNYAAWEMKKLREALESLDDRSRYIIKRRWLDEEKATLQELSTEFKISIERVRQVEANAMAKVKAILLNEGVAADETPALDDKSAKRKSKRGTSVRRNQTERSASTQLKRHAAAGSGVKALPNKKSVHTSKSEDISAKISGTALTEPLKKRRGRKKASATTETLRSGSSTISSSESTALLPAPARAD